MALHNKEDAIDTIILFYLRKMIKKNVDLISCICMKICQVAGSTCNYLVKVHSVCWGNVDEIYDEKDDVSNGDKNENDYVDRKSFFQ